MRPSETDGGRAASDGQRAAGAQRLAGGGRNHQDTHRNDKIGENHIFLSLSLYIYRVYFCIKYTRSTE